MANVNLGREQGVRVTGAAGHGGTNVNYAPAIGAVGQVGNAFENASRGIKHVSDSLFGIYNDLADSRNRQEFLEGQTAMFDFSNAENEKLEERIRNGEFDRAGGVEAFKAAAMQSQENIKKAFADWSGKNITQIDTRKALNEHLTLDSKRNFAHMSGRFIAHDNERRFGLMKSQCERAVEDGSMENLDAAIRAYCGGGKDKDGNELPRYKSQEFEDNLRSDYMRRFYSRRLEDAQKYLSLALSSEEVDKFLEGFKRTDAYGSLSADKKQIFDVFAANRMETAKRSEFDVLKKAEKEQLEDIQKGIEADVSRAYETCAELGKYLADNKISEMRDRLVQQLEYSHVPEGARKQILLKFDRYCNDERERVREKVEAALYRQAESALKIACEENNSDIDLDKLSGGDDAFSDKIKAARKTRQELVDRNETLYSKIRSNSLSKGEVEIAQNYRRDYFKVLSDAFDYDKDMDARGEKLARLIVEAQKFDRTSRRQLMGVLYNRVIKKKMPQNWSASDVKAFDEQFSEYSKWDNDETWGWGDDTDIAGYSALRDRIMDLAVARGLTYQQAIDELNKDPFCIKIKTKKARKDAIETFKINLL